MKTAIIVTPEITFKGVHVIEETDTEVVVTDDLGADKAIAFDKSLITSIIYDS